MARANKTVIFVYSPYNGILDYWPGWQTLDEITKSIAMAYSIGEDDEDDIKERLHDAKCKAHQLFLDAFAVTGGELSAGPYYTIMPKQSALWGNEWEMVVSWKVRNNGASFFACRLPMPWLMRPGVEYYDPLIHKWVDGGKSTMTMKQMLQMWQLEIDD